MDMQTSIRTVLHKYADFNGRAQRSELWWWALAVVIASIILSIVDAMMFGSPNFQPLSTIFGLAVLIPNIAVGARRLHDIDRSGWWLLVGLVPIVGVLVLIYWYVQPGTTGDNQYGPDPLGGTGGHYASEHPPVVDRM